ncbi:MAG: molecular chaperone HtpG, partial [Proteobacteria bacterium]|nr:molecular chaperone HtpG [Pseudomonadota bacterium]
MTVEKMSSAQTMNFQAEVKQLLHLMIHSLYSNREIFLRELVSNASDACDKLRFEALENAGLFENDSELRIRVELDKAQRTLTISDNGIGMSRDEVVTNLGTIAKSGTKEFFGKLTGDQKKDAHLIGQFGVGFYSAFIVADKVIVRTRRAGLAASDAVRWECSMTGDTAGEYTVEPIEKADRGTEITLHLREDQDDLLSSWKLRSIIQKYSDHILQPIVMKKEKWDEEKKEQVVTDELETVNKANALWARAKSDISDEEYTEFYKHVAHDYEEPLAWTHSKVEGRHEYTQLLYVPGHAPFDLWDRQARHGVKLYVRRVFIMDDAEQLMPLYLRFVRGVVDSADLPLNVSREILQQSKDIDNIRSGCTRKVLSMLEGLANSDEAADKEKYAKFWEAFGAVLKEGVGEDQANKDKIAGLIRFASTHGDGDKQIVSLADYIARMKDGQEKIYYVTADSFNAARNSPHLEIFKKKGIEVLLLSDRVDEWVVGHLTEFEGKQLQSVAKGGLDLGKLEDEAEKQEAEKAADEYKDLLEKVKTALGDKVKDVRVTYRLTDSPSCLVSDEHDPSGNLARLLKAAGQKAPDIKPILEINPQHPAVMRLKYEEARFDDWAALLFEQATLAEGG